MDLPTDLLRTFVIAANEESYTAAALVVHRTQSAVSMQMKRLEELVERRLFERNGHSMQLTPEGQLLLQYAQRILNLHDKALTALSRPELTGRVKLGTSTDYAENVLPLLLSRFSSKCPGVQIDLLCEPEFRLRSALKKGEIDLLIQTTGEKPTEGKIIHREHVVWVGSKKHLTHEHNPIPIAVYYDDCIYRKWAVDSLTGVDKEFHIACTSPSTAGILAAVRSGLAVAPVGLSTLTDDVRILDSDDGFPNLPTAYVSITTSSKQVTPATELLREHVVESFKEFGRIQRRIHDRNFNEVEIETCL